MRELTYPYAEAQTTIDRLKKGILLVSVDAQGKPNVMTTSWGFLGYQWSKPVYITPVQPIRFSHDLIAASGEFVISVQPPALDEAMMFCGAHSGRDTDKWQACGLKPVRLPLPGFRTPGVDGSLLHFACKVVHTASAKPLSPHTFFFGEVLKVYAAE